MPAIPREIMSFLVENNFSYLPTIENYGWVCGVYSDGKEIAKIFYNKRATQKYVIDCGGKKTSSSRVATLDFSIIKK